MIGPSSLEQCVVRNAAAMLIALVCGPALAQNWIGLLKNTPAERFDDDDIRMFLDAGRKALNDTPVGGVVSWQNPATGNRGEVTVLKESSWKDAPCRQLRIYNEAGGSQGTTNPSLCKIDGKWRAARASELKR